MHALEPLEDARRHLKKAADQLVSEQRPATGLPYGHITAALADVDKAILLLKGLA